MLGMMNSPNDAVEFYATNQNLQTTMCEEDLKAFTEAKKRPKITYTKDGRRMIDGKIEDAESSTPLNMWGNALMNGVVKSALKMQKEDEEGTETEGDKEETAEKKSEAKEVAPNDPQIKISEELLLTTCPGSKESQPEQTESSH
ncbi:unnamed protein product [Cylicocyclus nassatus]|uniref:Uncharacterized protein n=1 Tax=Cylicocyclus nassatus TaxID=53992 RepID=A0AA36ME42_CYLNA|nr:unnamed protein product [Cylicocyclus nassatus]